MALESTLKPPSAPSQSLISARPVVWTLRDAGYVFIRWTLWSKWTLWSREFGGLR